MQQDAQQTAATDNENESSLTISPEKVCFIIMKAKEFDAKDEVTEPERMTWMSRFLRSTRTTLSSRSLRR